MILYFNKCKRARVYKFSCVNRRILSFYSSFTAFLVLTCTHIYIYSAPNQCDAFYHGPFRHSSKLFRHRAAYIYKRLKLRFLFIVRKKYAAPLAPTILRLYEACKTSKNLPRKSYFSKLLSSLKPERAFALWKQPRRDEKLAKKK